MSRIDGIIFDCDGVLFESRDANLAYYNQVLEKFAYPLVSHEQKERAHLCHTACSVDVFAVLLKKEDVKPALDYAATLDFRDFIPFMKPEPHLPEVLEQLAAEYPLAVATNRGTSVEPILSHFGLEAYFSAVVTSKDVAKPKPAPDMLLLASQRLGFAPENCLFIGDSELDQMAAAGANVRFVGYGGLAGGEVAVNSHLQLLDYLPKG
ncbi:haloacid dehalogenase superfamily, subfamily IA, variant 3 with third motif having DD or ED/haloacid dehalogenase superfamily, subfamily IA, variant 1 with third motif having Dx(3-4)D or Dx(3-4)E [Malonomonas rubra DSM 5091]|uniref:phosphoglycolate phosphatase n=1 Tax=Malonomonas rubra DSM 5091 TaxID=1122189 RepID=A0A1M6CB15_MALRU|nr:HAD-IA family hydrolase [Malonomonas rubra]SHI58186.1 haloacid dehalogenase superfamily, subfamily IA, variant 3 with third motif having DD or ED/haloacid dehalogenase superfamily, subfamily IA, variant 1 with third motif having Dx(3-4)D or Dx(3-4)E [Malonomonas rubra DSM 5091]